MQRTGWAHRAVALGVMGAAGLGLAGCSNHVAWDEHAGVATAGAGAGRAGGVQAGAEFAGSDPSRLVFESPEVARANQDGLPFERWEFSRNDERVNAVRSVPLSAARQWPQPPRPAERRIRFSDWQQR